MCIIRGDKSNRRGRQLFLISVKPRPVSSCALMWLLEDWIFPRLIGSSNMIPQMILRYKAYVCMYVLLLLCTCKAMSSSMLLIIVWYSITYKNANIKCLCLCLCVTGFSEQSYKSWNLNNGLTGKSHSCTIQTYQWESYKVSDLLSLVSFLWPCTFMAVHYGVCGALIRLHLVSDCCQRPYQPDKWTLAVCAL